MDSKSQKNQEKFLNKSNKYYFNDSVKKNFQAKPNQKITNRKKSTLAFKNEPKDKRQNNNQRYQRICHKNKSILIQQRNTQSRNNIKNIHQNSQCSIEDIENSLKQDGYINLKLIHKGTYSVLLEAWSLKHNKNVCLKISKESQVDYQMMTNEFIILNSIQNSEYGFTEKSNKNCNIVEVIEFLNYPKLTTCIIVQELCQLNLEEEINQIRLKNTYQTNEEINTIFIHLINAINHIHSHKIIHCDIKPSNILKSQDGIYKICDFDLSTQLHQYQDSTNIMKGYTKFYMSPEQDEWNNNFLNNRSLNKITQNSDVFNLGIVFLEVLGETISEKSSYQIRKGAYFFSPQVTSSQWFQKILMMIKPNADERLNSSQLFGLLYPLELFSFKNFNCLQSIFQQKLQQNQFSQNTDYTHLLNSNLYLALTLESIISSEKYQNIQIIAKINQYISYIKCFFGDYFSCLNYCLKSLKYYEQLYLYEHRFIDQIIYLHLQASDIYILLNDFQQSIKQSQAAFDLIQKLNLANNLKLYGLALIYKCRQLRITSNLEESLIIGFQSFNILQQERSDYQILCLEEIAQTYEELGMINYSFQFRRNAINITKIEQIFQYANIPFFYHKILMTHYKLGLRSNHINLLSQQDKQQNLNTVNQNQIQMMISKNVVIQSNKLLSNC